MNMFKTLFSSFLATRGRWIIVMLLIIAIYIHYKYSSKDSKKNEIRDKKFKNVKNDSSKSVKDYNADNFTICSGKSVVTVTYDDKNCEDHNSVKFSSDSDDGNNNNIKTRKNKNSLPKNNVEIDDNNKIFNKINNTNNDCNYSLLNPSWPHTSSNDLSNASQSSKLLLSKLQVSKIHSIMKENLFNHHNKVQKVYDKNINDFKVITLNILADTYCRPSHYKNCARKYLKWNYRLEHIIEYLTKSSCELIALQEVDRFFDIEKYYNNNTGYNTYYMKRAIDKPDGLMLIWSRQYFQSYSCSFQDIYFEIRLNELADACFSKTLRQYYQQDNIACYTMLQSKHDLSHLIIFANCHLYKHPHDHDIQLTQMCYVLNIIYNHTQKIVNADKTIKNTLLILCGDFNFSPTSSCYWYLTHGEYIMKGCYNNDSNNNNELKFIMDPSLTKLAELCRNLGIDTTFFHDNDSDIKNGEHISKRNGNKKKLLNTENLCNKAKHESRYLITKSKSLISNQHCPSHLILHSKHVTENLREIIKHFDLSVDENCLYIRCAKCNVKYIKINRNESSEPTIHINSGDEHDQIKQATIFYQCLQCKKTISRGMKKLQNEERLLNSMADNKKSDDEFMKQMLINKLTTERYNSLPPNLQTYCCWKDISFKNPFFQNNCSLKSVAFEFNLNDNNFNTIPLNCMKYEQPSPVFDSIVDVTTLALASTSVVVSSLGSKTASPSLSSISNSSSMLSYSSILTPNYMFYCNILNKNNTNVGETNHSDDMEYNENQKNKNIVINSVTCQTGGVDYSMFDNGDNSNDNTIHDENAIEIVSENDSNSHDESCLSSTGDNFLLPSKYWHSDHLPVYAVFQLK